MKTNNKLFNNYKSECPICGGELDSDDRFCKYCGSDLSKIKKEYRDNEDVIASAIDDIDNAKRKLARREAQFIESKKKDGSIIGKIVKILVLLGIANFVILLIIGLIITGVESAQDEKIEQFKQSLSGQDVNLDEYDELDLNDFEFEKTGQQSAAGYIKQADGVFEIPLYADDYSSAGVFKGFIYVDDDGFEKFSSVYEDRVSITYEDCCLTIAAYNNYYYKDETDALSIYDVNQIDGTSRLNDIEIGDITFECYKIEEGYTIVANPFAQCYLVIEGSPSWDNEDFDFDEMMKVLRVDCDLELKHQ